MSIYLAYDGSINGDWIAHYAINFAAFHPTRRLRVLHVETTDISGAALADKFDTLRRIAHHAGVTADIEICPMHHGAFGGLIEQLPKGKDTVVVCGARVQAGRRGILSGTVSEKLLAARDLTAIALRIVQPGLLGVVRRLLLPVSEPSPDLARARTLLRLVAPSLTDLRLLYVTELSTGRFRALDVTKSGALLHQAQGYLAEIEPQLIDGIDLSKAHIDAAARVTDDWAREILVDAGRTRTDLMALEVPATNLQGRLAFGDPVEVILRDTPCDIALLRGSD